MGISIWQLLIILAIVLVLFGAKRLRTLGTDLGASVRGFRDAMKDGDKDTEDKSAEDPSQAERVIEADKDRVINGEVVKDKDKA